MALTVKHKNIGQELTYTEYHATDSHIVSGDTSDHGELSGLDDDDHSQYVLYSILQAAHLANEIMNFPSMEQADGAQPEWWEVSANTTLTEEDVAGEGITENYERCHKVVTTADNAYGYQRYTYADQPRVKSGRALSVLVAVWSVSGVTARIRLQSSVGSLDVATTTVAAWTVLKLEGAALDGTYVDLRFGVDTGTAYFVPLGLCIGEKAVPLALRGLIYYWKAPTEVKSLTGIGDEDTWTDVDCTSATSNLAYIAQLNAAMYDDTSGDVFTLAARRDGGGSGGYVWMQVRGSTPMNTTSQACLMLSDVQIFEYKLDREAGSGTVNWGTIQVIGWWEWA